MTKKQDNTDLYKAKPERILINPVASEVSFLMRDVVKKYITDNIRTWLNLESEEKTRLPNSATEAIEDKRLYISNFDDKKHSKYKLVPGEMSEDNFIFLKTALEQQANILCKELNSVIVIDEYLLRESLATALNGANERTGIIDDAALTAYAIIKFKPVRVREPKNILKIFEEAGVDIPYNIRKAAEDYEKEFDFTFPINEYLALTTAINLIIASSDSSIKEKKINKISSRVGKMYHFVRYADLTPDGYRLAFHLLM